MYGANSFEEDLIEEEDNLLRLLTDEKRKKMVRSPSRREYE